MSLALSYDDPGGFYADGAAVASWTPDESVALTRGAVDAGYSWRTAHGVVIDIGATRQQFSRHSSGGRATGYSEFYAGAGFRDWAARLSYSPDYFAPRSNTLYLSVDRVVRLSDTWRFTANAGTILYLSQLHVAGLRPVAYDYGIGIARRWKLVDFRLGLSSGGPDPDYYGQRAHRKTRLTLSGSIAF